MQVAAHSQCGDFGSARIQRAGGGAGKGEAAAGAAADGFLAFGRCDLDRAGLGGGPAGLNSANTGLGSMVMAPGNTFSPE
jgi:hypothetical protein